MPDDIAGTQSGIQNTIIATANPCVPPTKRTICVGGPFSNQDRMACSILYFSNPNGRIEEQDAIKEMVIDPMNTKVASHPGEGVWVVL